MSLLLFSGKTLLNMDFLVLIKLLVTLYTAALFLQSGLDKVFDWRGNSDYISGIFQRTILRPAVSLLLPVVTVLELGAGCCASVGAVVLLLNGQETWAMLGLLLGATSVLFLFTGLRIAKDYAAAAAITSYFVFFILALGLFAY